MDSNLKTTQNRSFTTITNINKTNYSLYRYWILDTGSNTHIINHYEKLTNVREILESSVLNKKRDIYQIKAYKNVKVNLTTPDGPSIITLFNIAYVPNYLTNIIAIRRLSRGDIYWSNSTPNIFTYEKKVFVNLKIIKQY